VIDTEARWEQARRLLHDESLKPEDRAAGLILLLYAQPGQARSTALFKLTTDLPAALLARMLGIHISVAVAWQRASSGDWTGYAADIGRRPEPHR